MKEGAPEQAGAPDEILMTAYAEGDAEAFDILYDRHKGALYRYFTRQLTQSEAHDCFQTLWLKIIDNRSRYQPSAPFSHFLFSLAHNVLMDHHRKAMRRRVDDTTDPIDLSDEAPDPAAALEREQIRTRLHQQVSALPTHQREVWLLRQETKLSTAEIAHVTGTSEEGVKSRLRYARDKLKSGMARYAERN